MHAYILVNNMANLMELQAWYLENFFLLWFTILHIYFDFLQGFCAEAKVC